MHELIESKQLRSRLGKYLKQVQEGLTLVVTKQGQPIAELRPYGGEDTAPHEHNSQIESEIGPEAVEQATPPQASSSTISSALGLSSYQCNLDTLEHMPQAKAEEPDLIGPDMPGEEQASAPEQAAQTEVESAGTLDAESAAMVSPAPSAQRSRSTRPRTANTGTAPKKRQRRQNTAQKESS